MAKQKTAARKSAAKSSAKKKQQQERTYPKGVEVLSSKVSFDGPIFNRQRHRTCGRSAGKRREPLLQAGRGVGQGGV